MTTKPFPPADSYWQFAQSVRAERRFLLTAKARTFLTAVRRTAERRLNVVPAGTNFWRAQRGGRTVEVPIDGTDETVTEDCPFEEERMKPLSTRAKEGRANPKGLPYLYLSSHRDTAAAEVRPWKGEVVSVGQFKAVRSLRLVNTTLESKRTFYLSFGRPPSATKREEAVWGDIDYAFATPTTATDDTADYVPTQVVAELFRNAGFDGIAYHSAYGEGHNVVLFDLALAAQVNCMLLRSKHVHFDFELEERFGYSVKPRAPAV